MTGHDLTLCCTYYSNH